MTTTRRPPDRPLRILQVNTVESGGGAATVAAHLQRGYREHACDAWLAVGRATLGGPGVFAIADDDRALYRATGYAALQGYLRRSAGREPGRGWGFASRSLRFATHPRALLNNLSGREDFEFPGTRRLLSLTPAHPDLVHAHNLHGGYFDLREIAALSRVVPVVLTLHDTWLLAGHCGYAFDCERWKTGCGACPDLTIDPAVRRDRTAENWRRKRDIYAASRVYVSAPCRWVLGKMEQSMLAPAVRASRVIPNGVDLRVFRPGDAGAARDVLGIPRDRFVVLLVGTGRDATWRDRVLLREASRQLVARHGKDAVLCVAVGHEGTRPEMPGLTVRFDGHQTGNEVMARYYQAADVYLHPARTDTFPLAVLESLACGTPVVATDVGGIGEQIRHDETGILIPAGDAARLAEAMTVLQSSSARITVLRAQAAADARRRFDVRDQVACYLDWYRTIMDDWARHALSDRHP